MPVHDARIVAQVPVGGHPKQVVVRSRGALVACMDGTLDIVDLKRKARVESVPLPGMPVDVVVDEKANAAVVSTMQTKPFRRGRVCKVDLATGRLTAVANLQSGWAKGMSIRPATRQLWVATWLTGSVEVVDLDTMETVARLPAGISPRGIAFSGDGSVCFVTDYYGRTVLHVDAARFTIRNSLRMPYRGLTYKGTPRDVLVGPAGSLTISNMGRGAVHRLSEGSSKSLRLTTVAVGMRPATLRYAANGDVWCACHGSAELWRLDATDLRPVERWLLPAPAYGIDVDGHTRVIAAVFDTGMLVVLESARNRSES